MHCLCRSYHRRQDLHCASTFCQGLHSDILTRCQANAGDSRSVLGVKGRAKPLSFDHKPQNEGSCHIPCQCWLCL